MGFRQCLVGAVLLGAVAVPPVVHAAPERVPAGMTVSRMVGQVYLMRGIANMFSYGLDDLARALRAKGIDATVHAYQDWPELAQQAVRWSSAHGGEPIVVIGHSLGADAALKMARDMSKQGVPPLLVITFDPVLADTVEYTGGRFLNYYQSNNGFGRALVKGRGFTGDIDNRDLRDVPGLHHFNLEKSAQLHAEVVETLAGLLRQAEPAPAERSARPRPPHRAASSAGALQRAGRADELYGSACAASPCGIVATNAELVR